MKLGKNQLDLLSCMYRNGWHSKDKPYIYWPYKHDIKLVQRLKELKLIKSCKRQRLAGAEYVELTLEGYDIAKGMFSANKVLDLIKRIKVTMNI